MSFFNMTKTLMKSLFHGPYTSQYPAVEKVYFDRSRGKISINIKDCIFCGLCDKRCPTGSIRVEKQRFSWSIDRLKCIQCNFCAEVCPKKCLHMTGKYSVPTAGNGKEEYTDVREPVAAMAGAQPKSN